MHRFRDVKQNVNVVVLGSARLTDPSASLANGRDFALDELLLFKREVDGGSAHLIAILCLQLWIALDKRIAGRMASLVHGDPFTAMQAGPVGPERDVPRGHARSEGRHIDSVSKAATNRARFPVSPLVLEPGAPRASVRNHSRFGSVRTSEDAGVGDDPARTRDRGVPADHTICCFRPSGSLR